MSWSGSRRKKANPDDDELRVRLEQVAGRLEEVTRQLEEKVERLRSERDSTRE